MSYSRDSQERVAWVTRLADLLERRREFHVIFDEYDLHGGRDLTHFMERGVRSDRVVVVVTPEYVRKAEGRHGGVGYESSIISADVLREQLADRVVPVLRLGNNRPAFLESKVFIDFRDDARFEKACSELIAALNRAPAAERPAKTTVGRAARPTQGHRASPASAPADGPRPLVVLRCDANGERNPLALPSVENIGDAPAANVKIEDIKVTGARGAGTFREIDILRPGEVREAVFDAPDEGLIFRDRFVQYLENDLENRPFLGWDGPRDLFTPLQIPLNVTYRDPRTGREYRTIHDLELAFGKHLTVKFRREESTH
jgi:hypothetical protein